MKTSDFNFDLPQELIAQTPIEKRDASRLLVLDKNSGAWEHRHFFDLPEYLHPGDCLILNDSRVLPARLLGQRLPGGGACEVLLLIDRGEKTWECLVRPGKHLRQGAKLSFGNGELTAEVTQVLEGGNRLVRFDYQGIFLEVLDRLGPCRRISRRSCRIGSGIRPYIPRWSALPPPPQPAFISQRNCCRRCRIWE
jgi:S-adenosylmethionine:tRNA ribosyltransferase-isomerase